MAFIQAQSEVHHALDQAERSVAATSQALLEGNPEQVRAATGEMHDSAHALALMLRGVDNGVALRDAVRERPLLRRSAAVDRSVQSLLPQSQPSTYGGALGRYAGRNMSGSAFFGSF